MNANPTVLSFEFLRSTKKFLFALLCVESHPQQLLSLCVVLDVPFDALVLAYYLTHDSWYNMHSGQAGRKGGVY